MMQYNVFDSAGTPIGVIQADTIAIAEHAARQRFGVRAWRVQLA